MCTLVTWARSGLKTAGSFQARALFIGLGLLQACSKIGLGLGVRPAGSAQHPGLRGLRLLVYVVKARPGANTESFGFRLFHSCPTAAEPKRRLS
jgi:hypothetical protein